jgi:hypothetical protein
MHNFIVPEEGGFNKQQQKRGQSNSFFYPTDQYTKTAPNSKYLYPRNEVVGGYTGFTMSVRPSVDKSYVVR